MDKKTNISANENACVDAIFSYHLLYLSELIQNNFRAIGSYLNKNKNEKIIRAINTLLLYPKTHNFREHTISVDKLFLAGLPFPYLPTILITEEKAREELLEKFKNVDFPTACAVFYEKDLNMIKTLYNFIASTKILGIYTNDFISILKLFSDDLEYIYKNDIYPHINKTLRAEVNSYRQKLDRVVIGEELFINEGNISYVNSSTELTTITALKLLGVSAEKAEQIAKYKFNDIVPKPRKSKVEKTVKQTENIVVNNKIISNVNWNK